MGQAMQGFHRYARKQTSATPYVSTHFIWPYHAAHSGLAIRWGLVDGDRALSLTRGDMGTSHSLGLCRQRHAADLTLSGEFSEAQFPPPMRWQCPYKTAILCPCTHASHQASPPPPSPSPPATIVSRR